MSGQLHAPAALPPGKEPLVLTGQETGLAPDLVWMQLNTPLPKKPQTLAHSRNQIPAGHLKTSIKKPSK
jgi:hypothetical protein